MDFNLTEDQRLLQTTVREFTQREIEPLAARIDREGRLPDDLIKKYAGVGLLGMTVPPRYGGSEIGKLGCILALEQLAYAGSGAWWLVGFHNSINETIARFGSAEIKEKYLPPLCDGSAYISLQFTEPDTGSEPEALGVCPSNRSSVPKGSEKSRSATLNTCITQTHC